MAVVYVLAHFDDEYCALPLIQRNLAEGRDVRFIHLVDYRSATMAQRRWRETLALLAHIGVGPDAQQHLGHQTGWYDGDLHQHLGEAYPALRQAVSAFPSVERLVTPAWEGGHPDHDCCAALTARLARDLGGVPVDQFGLYQGKGLVWLFYHACRPLAENGAAREIRLTPRRWAAWAALIRMFPSQLKAWSGLAPAMAMTFLKQKAFRYQALAPGRVDQRPHEGRLLYERMFGGAYSTVREAVDALDA